MEYPSAKHLNNHMVGRAVYLPSIPYILVPMDFLKKEMSLVTNSDFLMPIFVHLMV